MVQQDCPFGYGIGRWFVINQGRPMLNPTSNVCSVCDGEGDGDDDGDDNSNNNGDSEGEGDVQRRLLRAFCGFFCN